MFLLFVVLKKNNSFLMYNVIVFLFYELEDIINFCLCYVLVYLFLVFVWIIIVFFSLKELVLGKEFFI